MRRVRRFDNDSKVLAHILEAQAINFVIDVGANEGQFAGNLYRAGYRGKILSFEPLPAAREKLLEAASRNPAWQVAPPLALGKEHGKAVLHIAGNSISSSLYSLTDLQLDAAPRSAEVGQISVEVERLDYILSDVLNIHDDRLFLKLDTQGTEKLILEGATGVLDRIAGLKIELTLMPLYSGQPLFEEVYSYIRALGFEMWDVSPEFRDAHSGRMLQCDAVFLRSDCQTAHARSIADYISCSQGARA